MLLQNFKQSLNFARTRELLCGRPWA